MNAPLILAYPENEALAASLAPHLKGIVASLQLHRFPDGETLAILPDVAGRDVLLLCSLDRPDSKLLPLLFAADAARDQGARRVGLVAPYLSYMRQDRRFHPGEAITSRTFAVVLSRHVDFLVTVDPHLHRYHALDEIYAIPATAASSVAAIARWIHREVENPVLIGPDEESAQWVGALAALEGLPYTVLNKVRHDDFHVEVSLPDAGQWSGRTPVLVDDIISSAHTMIAAVRQLQQLGFVRPVCVGVHAIFAGTAYDELQAAGAGRIVTCNCVPHPSNAIDVMPAVAASVREMLGTAWGA